MSSTETSPTPPGALDGVRVVAIESDLAARLLAMLLAEQGASVVRVIDPTRPPADPVLDALLARGKTEVALDPAAPADLATLRRLVATADVVLDDLPAGALAALGLDLAAVRAADNPGLIGCTLPAFPAGDPLGALPPHETLVGAAGYLYEKPLGKPLHHGFPVGSVIAALFAASGVAAALLARLRDGRGQDVSVPRMHANLFAQVLQILVKTGVPRGFLPLKMVGTPFMGAWRCQDERYIYLHMTLPSHAALILDRLEALGHVEEVKALRAVLSAETMRDPSQVKSIGEAKRVRRLYERIFLSRPAAAWEELLGQELCLIRVRTVGEWLEDSIEAGMSDASRVTDPVLGDLLGPGPAVTCTEAPPRLVPRTVERATFDALLATWEADPRPRALAPDAPPADDRPPLADVRVLDLSRIIAGPCAARVLAELGADVLSLQAPSALDWALSFHLLFNAGKRSATLDSRTDAGKAQLLALFDDFAPDAVVQNYRHLDVARAAGVGPELLRGRRPDLVYTHLNAYGDQGVWRDRPGFEQVVQAVSGIQLSYSGVPRPKLLPTPVIDIGSGLSGAFATVLGLYRRARTGQGAFVTTHLTRTAVLLQVAHIAATQRDRANGADPGRAIVSGLVKTRDGWTSLSGPRADLVTWLAHRGVTAPPDADLLALAARGLRRRSVARWNEDLVAAGVGETVGLLRVPRVKRLYEELPAHDPTAPPLIARRDYGGCPTQLTFVRSPLALSRTPLAAIAPPPRRGEQTREVMATIGVTLPEGAGASDYPPDKALLPWLASVARWGYFAWRSGNI